MFLTIFGNYCKKNNWKAEKPDKQVQPEIFSGGGLIRVLLANWDLNKFQMEEGI